MLSSIKEFGSSVFLLFKFLGLITSGFLLVILVIIMLFASGEDLGCITDNGAMDASFISSRGWEVEGNIYNPIADGGQRSGWKSEGLRANGEGFLINISGRIYTGSTHGLPSTDINRCRICAKSINRGNKFRKISDNSAYDPNNHNCLCTKIRGINNINDNNLNSNPNLNHINIRENPTQENNVFYCHSTEDVNNNGQYQLQCSNNNDYDSSDSNKSCSNNFYFDSNNNGNYDDGEEIIPYNHPDIYYINLDYRRKNQEIKDPINQRTCYVEGGYGAMIGLFGHSGMEMPPKLYSLYTEYYLPDIDQYQYNSPDNQIYEDHQFGERIKIIFDDGWYQDNRGNYNFNFIEGIVERRIGPLIESLVYQLESVFQDNGFIERTYIRLVSNNIFATLVKLLLILYVLFMGFGIITGTMEISRKEFFGRFLKIALILFLISPNSWQWYNQIVVNFFQGATSTLTDLALNSSYFFSEETVDRSNFDTTTGNGFAQRFAFPDKMIKVAISQNISIKIWSLLFSPYNVAAIFIIFGYYICILYFIYIILQIAILYATAMISSMIMLSIGPVIFLSTFSKVTAVAFYRWVVFLGSRILEIIMIFLVLYAFLSTINNKIGLYGEAKPESLLYFESCPHSLYDIYKDNNEQNTRSSTNYDIGNNAEESIIDNTLRSFFSFFRIYVADPTTGIRNIDGNYIGGKDFFEMISIIMEVLILLYFLNMIISQVGKIASSLTSYQQQKSMANTRLNAIAREGSELLATIQNNAREITNKIARPAISKAFSGAKKYGTYAFDYVGQKAADSRLNNFAEWSGMKSKYNKFTSPASEMYEKRMESKVKPIITAAEKKFKKLPEELLEPQIRNEVMRQMSQSNVMNVRQSDAVLKALDKYFIQKDINAKLNDLRSRKGLITNKSAEDSIRKDLAKKYQGQAEFSKILRQQIAKNLRDKEVLDRYKAEEEKIISEIMKNNPNLDIKTGSGYQKLQEKLQENSDYQNLKKHIAEHKAHKKHDEKQYFKTFDKIFTPVKTSKEVAKYARKNPVKTTIGTASTIGLGILAAPLLTPAATAAGVATLGRGTYKAVRYSYNNIPNSTKLDYLKNLIAINSDNPTSSQKFMSYGLSIASSASNCIIAPAKAIYNYNYKTSIALDKAASYREHNNKLKSIHKKGMLEDKLKKKYLNKFKEKAAKEGISEEELATKYNDLLTQIAMKTNKSREDLIARPDQIAKYLKENPHLEDQYSGSMLSNLKDIIEDEINISHDLKKSDLEQNRVDKSILTNYQLQNHAQEIGDVYQSLVKEQEQVANNLAELHPEKTAEEIKAMEEKLWQERLKSSKELHDTKNNIDNFLYKNEFDNVSDEENKYQTISNMAKDTIPSATDRSARETNRLNNLANELKKMDK